MTEHLELHDSEVSSVSVGESSVEVLLSPAYLHRSLEQPGQEADSGWLCAAILTFTEATLSSMPGQFPSPVWEGFLRVGTEKFDNLIPSRGSFTSEIEFSATLTSGEILAIRAKRVNIELRSEPTFLEHLHP